MSADSTHDPGPALIHGLWAAFAIAIVIVVLRIIAKIKIRQFRLDDALMILALAMSLSSTALLNVSVDHGFGKNLKTLPPDDLRIVLKYIAIQVLLVTLSTGIARSAFALYLLTILGTNRLYQALLWTASLLQLAGNIVSAVLPLSICRDARILWDPTIKTTCGNTVDVVKFSYFSSSVNSATDLFLAVFPTVIFWNLNLRLRVKISLIILMGLGILAMVASIIKTPALDSVPSVTNLGANGAIQLIRWGYAENVIIIITSSVPCVRPLVMSSVRKISSSARSRSRSYQMTSQSRNKRTTEGKGASSGPSSGPSNVEQDEYHLQHKGLDQGLGQEQEQDRRRQERQRERERELKYRERIRYSNPYLNDRMAETASLEQTLAGGSSDEERGITKQVDIEVTSDGDGGSTRRIIT